jgi:hypothetical protein
MTPKSLVAADQNAAAVSARADASIASASTVACSTVAFSAATPASVGLPEWSDVTRNGRMATQCCTTGDLPAVMRSRYQRAANQ